MKHINLSEIKYASSSFIFNRGVIAAYFNGLNRPIKVTQDYIRIENKDVPNAFLLNETYDEREVEGCRLYSEHPILPILRTEICYNLDELFALKWCQNWANWVSTQERIFLVDYDKQAIIQIFSTWLSGKTGVNFPEKYLRSFQLKENGFQVYQRIAFVDDKPYAAISFSLDKNVAYQLIIMALTNDRSLRIGHNQCDRFLLHCYRELYMQGIRTVNVGPAATINNDIFKRKYPHFENLIYSNVPL